MRISPQWLREFVDLTVDERQLADDLTLAGIAVESVREMDGKTLFEMEIGTNRPDAMCHYGVARECSAIYDLNLRPLPDSLPPVRPAASPFVIEIEDQKGCGRYTARVIRGVNIAPSPSWVLGRLKIDDHNGVNNAVDASNYTLMEMGHPTHAFDLDKLEGGKIVVRRARPGETLTTLDGVQRKLEPEDLVIADAVKPVALAGIMGGLDSAISGTTRNILIESAWFDPATVRRTARRQGMHTDASHIFERGADWGATPAACDRVATLILETAGGELEGEAVDVRGSKPIRYSICLRAAEIKRHLGQEIPEATVERILQRLGFSPRGVAAEKLESVLERVGITFVVPAGGSRQQPFAVRVPAEEGQRVSEAVARYRAEAASWGRLWIADLPTWRLDIEREIDLVEEIARIYGYNKFSNTLPAFAGEVIELPDAGKESRLRATALALGYNEAISSSFISPADATGFSSSAAVLLANPLSEEQSAMRTSLAPGMLGMLAWNINRGTTTVRLFEMGHVFELAGEISSEHKVLSLGVTGNAVPPSVHGPARPCSFHDLKGDIKQMLTRFELQGFAMDTKVSGYYHPGRSARIISGGSLVAQFGQLHPDVAAARKLRQEIYIAELYLDALFKMPLRSPRYEPLSKYPAVERDFSFSFEDRLSFAQIHSTVGKLRIRELLRLDPVEVFRGGTVPAGRYSVLLRAQFQSAERTLRDDEVAAWSAQVIKALEAIGGTLRK